MHIPDGFLDGKTIAVASVLSAGGIGTAIRSLHRETAAHQAPMLGLTGAFVFAAQMLNFPVAAGTSGHLIGAALAAALLGPAAAVVVMTSVVVLQCFLFNDGGLLALGANLFNMAVVAPIVGWAVFRLVARPRGLRRRILGVAFASWCSVEVAALLCAGELAWSGTIAARLVLPAMTGVHFLIGLGEAVIASLVLAAIARANPELLDRDTGRVPRRSFVIVGALIAAGLAVFLSPFASSFPDGLEWIADRLGFAGHASPSPWTGPLPGYAVPGLASSVGGTMIAGLAGTLLAFGLSWLLARVLSRG